MDFVAVMAAGFLGAAARALLSDAVPAGQTSGFPLNTLIVNILGCFVLSFFMNLTMTRLIVNPRLRLAVSTGFLGAFTTFSTYTMESFGLLQSGPGWAAALYITGTPVGCLLAAWLGVVMSRSMKLLRSAREDQ